MRSQNREIFLWRPLGSENDFYLQDFSIPGCSVAILVGSAQVHGLPLPMPRSGVRRGQIRPPVCHRAMPGFFAVPAQQSPDMKAMIRSAFIYGSTSSSDQMRRRGLAFKPGRVCSLCIKAWLLFLVPWIVYGPSLFFPLFYDDLLHLALVEGRLWTDLLRPMPEYGYYRPLILLWTRVVFAVSGSFAPLVFHFSTVAIHLLNIALLVQLLRRIPTLRPFAMKGSIVFGLFPFHYQAILTPAFSLHIWQTAFFISAGILYVTAGLHTRVKHLLLLLISCLAILNHETGVLMGVFLFGVDRLAYIRSRRWLPYLIAGIGYTLLYQTLPRGSPPETMLSPAHLIERLRFAFQAFAFPLIPGLTRLLGEARLNRILGLAFLWIMLSWLVFREDSRQRAGGAGFFFFLLAIMPSVLLLPTGYFLHGPRLLYLGSVGASVFWATRLKAPPSSRLRTLHRLAFAVVIALAWIISKRQADLYAMALEPWRRIRDIPPSASVRRALLVNLPEWVAFNTRIFPLGSEGTLVFGGHLLPETILIANSALRSEVELMRADLPFHRPQDYAFQTAGQAAGPVELLHEMEKADLILFTVYREAGPQTELLLKSEARLLPLRVAFSEGLVLQEGLACARASTIRIYLRWTRHGPVSSFLSLAVHLLDSEDHILAQADGPPWYGAIPFEQIPEGESLLELRTVLLHSSAQPIAVRIGLYDWQSGRRVSIQTNPYALPVKDGTFINLPIHGCPG